jgi:hypothetical protein
MISFPWNPDFPFLYDMDDLPSFSDQFLCHPTPVASPRKFFGTEKRTPSSPANLLQSLQPFAKGVGLHIGGITPLSEAA